ncbi:hypothetical protein PInf_008319 [Phytophthora infestans]|nr:hypothetical protein PInf_008319 [Phytophthora infestans]
MAEVLRRGYGDEAVARLLQQTAANAKDADTRQMAVRLQDQQFTIWKKLGFKNDDVFKRLGLDKDGVTLENPNFVAWGKFVKSWSGEKATPFDSLWARYGEKGLAKMLVAPREKVGGNDVYTFWQNQLVKKWLTMIRGPDDVAAMVGPSYGGKTLASFYRWNFEDTFGVK